MSAHDTEMSELTVLFKALYEWIYHLEIRLKEDLEVRRQVSPEMWNRLDAYAEFRNGLIAHKQRRMGAVIAGLRTSSDFEWCRLTLNTWGVDSTVENELEKLFHECVDHPSPVEAQENNFYERCRILNTRQHELAGKLRARVIAFIRRHGAESENVSDLAEFIAALAEDLLPRLP
jgi:hypothetical protein